MILLDERARDRRELALDNEILLRALRQTRFWESLAVRYIGRAIFYRELCALQQQTLSQERAAAARTIERLRARIAAQAEEIACRSGVTKERP